MSTPGGGNVYERIPYIFSEYEGTLRNSTNRSFDINGSINTPNASVSGPWFPIPQGNLEREPELKKIEDTTPPNFVHFLYEYGRAYPPDSDTGNVKMVDLRTKNHSPVNIDTLYNFGKRLNCKARSYYRSSMSEIKRRKSCVEEKPTFPFLLWVDITQPTEDDMRMLEQAFGIHDLTSEDILTSTTREKQEDYPNYSYFVVSEVVSTPMLRFEAYNTQNINILIFPAIIFTIHKKELNAFPKVLYQFLYETAGEVSLDWVLYKIFDSNVKEISSVVDILQKDVVMLDNSVDSAINAKSIFLRRLGLARQRVTKVRNEFHSKKEILSYILAESTSAFIDPDTKFLFRDVYDNIKVIVDRLEMSYEMLSNTNNTYLAMISLEQSVTNQKINEVMKCFGAVTTLVIPVTIITGMWGMNVQVPLQFGITSNTLDWFNFVVIGCLTWVIIGVIVFRYNRCM